MSINNSDTTNKNNSNNIEPIEWVKENEYIRCKGDNFEEGNQTKILFNNKEYEVIIVDKVETNNTNIYIVEVLVDYDSKSENVIKRILNTI